MDPKNAYGFLQKYFGRSVASKHDEREIWTRHPLVIFVILWVSHSAAPKVVLLRWVTVTSRGWGMVTLRPGRDLETGDDRRRNRASL